MYLEMSCKQECHFTLYQICKWWFSSYEPSRWILTPFPPEQPSWNKIWFIFLLFPISIADSLMTIFFRLHDLGLRQHDKASLLVELLIPTLFSIALVIQLHFFHKPMTMKINHLLILRKQSKDRIRLTSPQAEAIEDQGPGPSGVRQQQESIVSEPTGTDSELDTEKMEVETTNLYRFLWFYKNTSRILWRIAEIHATKVVSFVIMLVVVQQVRMICFFFTSMFVLLCHRWEIVAQFSSQYMD